MTEFNDGDEIIGKYGLHFTRRDGLWYSDTGKVSHDETIEWPLSLNKHTRQLLKVLGLRDIPAKPKPCNSEIEAAGLSYHCELTAPHDGDHTFFLDREKGYTIRWAEPKQW